jgi:RNA polymerase sigma factor (TIGR02999 family)
LTPKEIPKRTGTEDRLTTTPTIHSKNGKKVGYVKYSLIFSSAAQSSCENMSDATLLLTKVEQGDPKAADELLELVYQELRQLATRKMAQEPPGQTIQPTALVHEAWLRLIGSKNPSFENRAHFFSAAAEAMRRILIDRARRRRTQRHGGGYERVDLDKCDLVAPQADDEMLAVHEALDGLAKEYPVQAEVVKLRYFGGRTNQQVAQILDISLSTVKNYWAFARAWLLEEIKGL